MEERLPEEQQLKTQEASAEKLVKKFWQNKKIWLLSGAGIFALALLGLLFFLKNQQNNTPPPPVAQASLGSILLQPTTLLLGPGVTDSVDVTINTGGNLVSGVVLAIQYNPLLLENVRIEHVKDKTSAISSALIPAGPLDHDTDNGTILLSLKIPEDVGGLSGKGTVAKLTFTRRIVDIPIYSTEITLLPITNFVSISERAHTTTRNKAQVTFVAK